MNLYRDNRAGTPATVIPDEELVRQFWASSWADIEWPLDRCLRAFLNAPEAEGGLGMGWGTHDDPDGGYAALFDAVFAARPWAPADEAAEELANREGR